MTYTIPHPFDWLLFVLGLLGSLLFMWWLLRAATAKELAQLIVKSAMEQGRFSPRLLTILFFVILTGYLENKIFAMEKSEALMLVYVQIIFANIGLITVLLGVGKVSDTFSKVQLEKPASDTKITSEKTTVTGDNVTVNKASEPVGEDGKPISTE